MIDNVYILIFYSVFAIFILVFFFLLLYIRNQNMIWKQRKLFQETEIAQQKQLLNAVIESQELERKRIGGDLHDEIGGALSAIKLMLGALKTTEEKQNTVVVPAKELIDKMIVDVRNISHDLSPPGLAMFGLYTSIEGFVSLINNSGQIEIEISHNPLIEERFLSEKTELALFRILTQLISNTLKHANASKVSIHFTPTDNRLMIDYADNGNGFELEVLQQKKGIGMQNIISRLQMIEATYKMESSLGNGFKMNIDLKMH